MNFEYIDFNDTMTGGNASEVVDKNNENIYIYLKQNKLDNQLIAKNK